MHITVNLAVLLVLGIPLEMVHGWWRVLTIFFTGAVFGSLLTSVTDPTVYLAGASGGVYAIITAHLATIIMVKFCDSGMIPQKTFKSIMGTVLYCKEHNQSRQKLL
jgi:membrane associated rhomboid family serine protease